MSPTAVALDPKLVNPVSEDMLNFIKAKEEFKKSPAFTGILHRYFFFYFFCLTTQIT